MSAKPENIPINELAMSSPPKRRKLRWYVWLQALIFIACIGLFAYLLYTAGLSTIAGTVASIGWGFAFIVAISGARHLVRSYSLYLAIAGEHRSVSFLNVLAARLAGEAVTLMTITGPFLGDATKIAMLQNRQTLSHSASAVIIDDIMYYSTVAFMILTGIALLTVSVGPVDVAMWTALVIVVVLVLLILAALVATMRARFRPLSFLLKRLDRRGWLPMRLAEKRQHIHDVESTVVEVFFERPGIFYALLLLGVFTHFLSVLEVYTVIKLLGVTPGVADPYIIESLNKVINFAFSFIPGLLGVYEGGNGLFFRMLGYTSAFGLSVALVRRGAILIWVGAGVGVIAARTASRGKREILRSRSAGDQNSPLDRARSDGGQDLDKDDRDARQNQQMNESAPA